MRGDWSKEVNEHRKLSSAPGKRYCQTTPNVCVLLYIFVKLLEDRSCSDVN